MKRVRPFGAEILILVAIIVGVLNCAGGVANTAESFQNGSSEENAIDIVDLIFFITGLISGVVIWYVPFHFFVPQIGFSKSLRRKNGAYEIRISNEGPRLAVDLTIFARLTLPDPRDYKRKLLVDMKLNTNQVPFLGENAKIFRICPGSYNELTVDPKSRLGRKER